MQLVVEDLKAALEEATTVSWLVTWIACITFVSEAIFFLINICVHSFVSIQSAHSPSLFVKPNILFVLVYVEVLLEAWWGTGRWLWTYTAASIMGCTDNTQMVNIHKK